MMLVLVLVPPTPASLFPPLALVSSSLSSSSLPSLLSPLPEELDVSGPSVGDGAAWDDEEEVVAFAMGTTARACAADDEADDEAAAAEETESGVGEAESESDSEVVWANTWVVSIDVLLLVWEVGVVVRSGVDEAGCVVSSSGDLDVACPSLVFVYVSSVEDELVSAGDRVE